MAVTPGYVTSSAISWTASATATVSGVSIGTASADRVVIVAVAIEDNVDFASCTIGGVAATAGPAGRNTTGTPDNVAAFFYLPVSTGTTANISVTLSASTTMAGRLSVWATTGANLPPSDTDSNVGAASTITLTALTVQPGGAGYFVFNNTNDTAIVAWTGATERDDTDAVNFRYSAADTVTSGTNTITADGAAANQVIVGMALDPAPTVGWVPRSNTATKSVASLLIASSMFSAPSMAPPEPPPPELHLPDAQVATSITTGSVFRRTLFYQAHVTPLPPVELAEVVGPDKWQIAWKGPPRYQANFGPFGTFVAQPIVVEEEPAVDQIAAVASVTTTGVSAKTLFYQSVARPPYVPEAVVVAAPTVEWLQPFKRQVAGPFPVHTQPVLSYAQPPAVTPDEWMPSWTGPPRQPARLVGGQPFIPAEATRENTVTPDKWLRPLGRAAPIPQIVQPTQPVAGYPYEAADNTRTEWDWSVAWQGPPRYLPPRIAAQPFVPREAVLDNTVTPDAWLFRFQRAVPVPPVRHTQPVFGYPYAGVDNSHPSWDWSVAWQGPPRLWPLGKPYQPFIPKEAVLENTVTPDKWMAGFQRAVATPPVRPTQPVFGYPYEAASNLTTTIEWQIAWKGPPRLWPLGKPFQPFVPKEATLENTVTPDKWLAGFQSATPRKPVHTQPVAGRSYVPAPTPEWLTPFGRALPRKPIHTQPVYGYAAPTLTTTLEWMQAWRGPPQVRPVHTQPVLYAEPVVVANLTSTLEWQPPLSVAVKARPVRRTQPVLHYEPEAVVGLQDFRASATSTFVLRKTRFYQARVMPLYPYLTDASQCIAAFQFGGFQFNAFQTCTNITTTLAWMPAWRGPPRIRPRHTQPVGRLTEVPFVFVDNTTTIDKWQQPLGRVIKARPVHRTQPVAWYKPLGVAAPTSDRFRAEVSGGIVYRKTLFYQSWVYQTQGYLAPVYGQSVTAGLTVEVSRMTRTVCHAESGDSSSEQAETTDPWTTQDEIVVSFVDETEQTDPWSTQDEQEDTSTEEDETPEQGCP